MPQIEVTDLTKVFRVPAKVPGFGGAVKHLFLPKYERKTAVDHISFSIEPGESVAYVGPNGAGKSTTIKMLTGILHPTGGSLVVRGLNPWHQRITNAKNIGVVFGQRTQLWWDLPVQESLRLVADIYEVPEDRFRKNLGDFLEVLDLGPLLARPARQLSLGQRMRCDLAASLLHSPPILYLDEPTIGLDVAVKERIRQFIRRRNRETGVTVLLTTHDLGDIENLCDRMIMIDKGKILFDGPITKIRDWYGGERVAVFILSEDSPRSLEAARAALPELTPESVCSPGPFTLSVKFLEHQITAAALVARVMGILPVVDLRLEEPDIESIIRQMYEGTLDIREGTA
ncbi:MAG: ATP-binding cassette domain-containing protein [Anaerolineales bacterium]|nr:ATP-binding cassette domain-containing protein [Anaerolineales bacterium]